MSVTPPNANRQPRRFAFFRRLTRGQKREYDRSDAITVLPLRPSPALGATTNGLVAALERGDLPSVRRISQDLADAICLGLAPRGRAARNAPRIRVLRTRPLFAGGEFHGLYTQTARGSEIRVWMFTAAQKQIVKPRTFLRTLLHEVVHHLDMTLLDFPSSFHTLGFHARESSLLRALERSGARVPGGRAKIAPPLEAPPPKETVSPESRPAPRPAPPEKEAVLPEARRARPPAPPPKPKPPRDDQLDLFAMRGRFRRRRVRSASALRGG